MDKNVVELEPTSNRMNAGAYIERIKAWQMENGGFRRMPPKSYDAKLYNWIQRCKFDYRNGALNTEVAESLLALGLLSTEKGEARSTMETQADYDRAMWAISTLKRMGAEDANGPTGDGLRKDASLSKWLDDIKALAESTPTSRLIGDLRWMMPRVYALEIEPHISKTATFRVERRRPEDLVGETYRFIKRRGRLPDMMSNAVDERKMASWIIRLETGFEAVSWDQLGKNEHNQEMVEFLQQTIASTDKKQRNAQWRWWSSVAMHVMRNPVPKKRWQDLMFEITPEVHAKSLELDIANVRAGKEGWDGGAYGADIMCVTFSLGKASQGSGRDKRQTKQLAN